MVRALLDGRKAQTRRVIKPPPVNLRELDDRLSRQFNDPDLWGYAYAEDGNHMPLSYWLNLCNYGQPGDYLWVRETWDQPYKRTENENGCIYRADYGYKHGLDPNFAKDNKWKSPIHMFRWASRLTLLIEDIRVERVQDISESDAIAEGTQQPMGMQAAWSERDVFYQLWNSINGKPKPDGTDYSWEANPWVWVIEFKVIQKNIDEILKTQRATDLVKNLELVP